MPRQPHHFKSIRSWDGSQHRAFEELCYQLLGRAELPEGAPGPIRTGNPDGGVEWYAELPDGTQWGWQAKFIENTDSLLNGMQATVRRVVTERPRLTRLTFCIATNLPSGAASGSRRSARQRYEDRLTAWRKEIAGADKIDFHLVQESDLLDRLARPQHAGLRLFWFDEAFLDLDRLERLYQQQRSVAGRRYRPELQVDLPIEDDLRALGFADHFFEQLEQHRRSFIDALRWMRLPDDATGEGIGSTFKTALDDSQALRDCFRTLRPQASDADPLRALEDCATRAEETLANARALAFELDRKTATKESSKEQAALVEKLRSDAYYAGRALSTVRNLVEFLSSPAARAVRTRAYFLAGSAGTGKTHLLLDSVRKALDEGRPAAVLFGAAFGDANLWPTIAAQLGLGAIGQDDLLGAMSACAEAASLQGRRFVLAIDALNETTDPTFWQRHLPTLRAALAQWPLLALAVSCRDTYLESVDPEERRESEFVKRKHPGFSGREVAATHKYFSHYGLSEPRIPLLLPEFTVPLFLQLYCQSLCDTGLDAPPDHHESRLEIFKRFVETTVRAAVVWLAPAASSFEREAVEQDLRLALDALVDECIGNRREGVSIDQALGLAAHVCPRSGIPAMRLYGALEHEAVLTRDHLYIDGNHVEGLRFTFQAFADYMILRRRIGGASRADVLCDDVLREWVSDASFGVIEAAAVVMPELYGVELPDYLEPVIQRRAADAGEAERVTENRLRRLEHQFLTTLPYRSAMSITQRTIDLINLHLSHEGDGSGFFEVLFALAPQPNHRLNGDGLHRYLMRQKMPERDVWFGQSVYYALSEESPDSAARLARWAADGPYPTYDPDVLELASVPLVWLLSSPNRFMRDWVTKALVQLLHGHPGVLLSLLARFVTVDDPYVWERLVAVAYGCVMRVTDPEKVEGFRPVCDWVSGEIFAQLGRFVPDALMLDAARGIIEWAANQGFATDTALAQARPPYGSKPPGRTWTKKTIEERYYDPYKGRGREGGYWSIYGSLFSLGDFGKYVVDSGLHHFSSTPLLEPAPSREDPPEPAPRLNKRKWSAFEKSLDEDQRAVFECLESVNEGEERSAAMRAFFDSLSPQQSTLLSESWSRPPARRRRCPETQYSGEFGRRWVFQRVIRLGWTPDRFGSFDGTLGYSNTGRDAHKAERFGKKYQWIAYHELLARVSDNYHVDVFDEEQRSYDGLYQIGDREIDPSLQPISFSNAMSLSDTAEDATSPSLKSNVPFPPHATPDFVAYRIDVEAFLGDTESLPLAERIIRVEDPMGKRWVLLNGRFRGTEITETDGDDEPQLMQWCHASSWLVSEHSLQTTTSELLQEVAQGGWSDLIETHGHADCCYLGELGWRSLQCYFRRPHGREVCLRSGKEMAVFDTAEDYTWGGGGFDCSIGDTVSLTVPSAFLQRSGALRWNGSDGAWVSDGQAVITFVATPGGNNSAMLVARDGWLREYLKAQELVLVVATRGERQRLAGFDTYRQPRLEFASVVALNSKGETSFAMDEITTDWGEVGGQGE